MRLDTFLWFARIVRTRTLAQDLVGQGHVRIDGRPVGRAHAEVRPGQVLAFPLHGRVRVLRVESLPARRGPAPEARGCYTDLDAPPVDVLPVDWTAPAAICGRVPGSPEE